MRPAAHRYCLLASALAGRRVAVSLTERAAYTDGENIFLPAGQDDEGDDLVAVAVQACLLAAGSLEPKIAGRLVGQRDAALRYFSLEVARATQCSESRLPRSVARVLSDHRIDRLTGSSTESLARAMHHGPIPLAPERFGTIRPKELIKGARIGATNTATPDDRNGNAPVAEIPELGDEDGAGEFKLLKQLSTPLSGTTATNLLLRLFGGGRRSQQGSSSGGAELPVGSRLAVGHVGPKAKLVVGPTELKREHRRALRVDGLYPEWDFEAERYRPGYCWVTEYDPPRQAPKSAVDVGWDPDLSRRLAPIGLSARRHRRQTEGDAPDLDALVDLMVDRAIGHVADDRVYEGHLRTARDLGVVVLLDSSGSTGERHRDHSSTYEEQRRLAARLAATLERNGDRVALFSFSSQGRQAIRFHRIKEFDDHFDDAALRRLAAVEPGGYTRLGAAIRHGLRVVTTKSGTTNRLLVVISDGFPYDDDGYEGVYAERDTRQALAECLREGAGAVGLSIATSTREAALERVFGSAPYLRLADVSDLGNHVAPAFRSALRLAGGARKTLTEST